MGGRSVAALAWAVVLRGLTVARCVEKDLHVAATNDGARVEREHPDLGHRLPTA